VPPQASGGDVMTTPPGEFGIGGVRIPGMRHAQTEDTPPSDNVRHLVLAEKKARIDLAEKVDALGVEMAEFRRVIVDFKRHLHRGQWWRALGSSAVFGTIIAAVLALAGQVWSAKLVTEKQSQVDYSAEQRLNRESIEIAAKLSAQLADIRTELEQQRRGYPAPMR
jgi:hypothetical protein